MKISIVFLAGAFIILLLKGFNLGLKRLTIRYAGFKIGDNLRAAVVLVVWLGYIFWATDFLFRQKFYYPYLVYSLILIVVVFVSWFLLRDIFAGIIFRAKHNLKTDSYVRAGEFSGQIKSQQLTYMKIMTGDKQLLRVPYSLIINEVITELAFPDAMDEHIIKVRSELAAGNANSAESLIRSVILNTPWSNLKEEPSIRCLKETEDGCFFEVTLLSIDKKQKKFIEMALKEIPSLNIIS